MTYMIMGPEPENWGWESIPSDLILDLRFHSSGEDDRDDSMGTWTDTHDQENEFPFMSNKSQIIVLRSGGK